VEFFGDRSLFFTAPSPSEGGELFPSFGGARGGHSEETADKLKKNISLIYYQFFIFNLLINKLIVNDGVYPVFGG
jgi:hypothetical protein